MTVKTLVFCYGRQEREDSHDIQQYGLPQYTELLEDVLELIPEGERDFLCFDIDQRVKPDCLCDIYDLNTVFSEDNLKQFDPLKIANIILFACPINEPRKLLENVLPLLANMRQTKSKLIKIKDKNKISFECPKENPRLFFLNYYDCIYKLDLRASTYENYPTIPDLTDDEGKIWCHTLINDIIEEEEKNIRDFLYEEEEEEEIERKINLAKINIDRHLETKIFDLEIKMSNLPLLSTSQQQIAELKEDFEDLVNLDFFKETFTEDQIHNFNEEYKYHIKNGITQNVKLPNWRQIYLKFLFPKKARSNQLEPLMNMLFWEPTANRDNQNLVKLNEEFEKILSISVDRENSLSPGAGDVIRARYPSLKLAQIDFDNKYMQQFADEFEQILLKNIDEKFKLSYSKYINIIIFSHHNLKLYTKSKTFPISFGPDHPPGTHINPAYLGSVFNDFDRNKFLDVWSETYKQVEEARDHAEFSIVVAALYHRASSPYKSVFYNPQRPQKMIKLYLEESPKKGGSYSRKKKKYYKSKNKTRKSKK